MKETENVLIQFKNKMILNVSVLKKAFDNFDREKNGSIPCEMVGSILRLMGQACNDKILKELIREIDSEGNVFHV